MSPFNVRRVTATLVLLTLFGSYLATTTTPVFATEAVSRPASLPRELKGPNLGRVVWLLGRALEWGAECLGFIAGSVTPVPGPGVPAKALD